MKIIFALFTLIISASCAVAQQAGSNDVKLLDSLLKRRQVPCKLNIAGKHVVDKRTFVRNAAYAYHYWYPSNFKDFISKTYTDTEKYISPDDRCELMLWPGATITFPLGAVDSAGKFLGVKLPDMLRVDKRVNDYSDSLKNGKEKFIEKIKIDHFCKSVRGYFYEILLTGTDNKSGYIYKIIVSELPVSGDLIFKHFLYKYQLRYAKQYKQVGELMANDFTDY